MGYSLSLLQSGKQSRHELDEGPIHALMLPEAGISIEVLYLSYYSREKERKVV
jgi:hypothetical protein